jgi:hypothetical protein
MAGRTPAEQKMAVLNVLNSLLPSVIPWACRTFFRPTELTAMTCAYFAHIGFEWVRPFSLHLWHFPPVLMGLVCQYWTPCGVVNCVKPCHPLSPLLAGQPRPSSSSAQQQQCLWSTADGSCSLWVRWSWSDER